MPVIFFFLLRSKVTQGLLWPRELKPGGVKENKKNASICPNVGKTCIVTAAYTVQRVELKRIKHLHM